MSRILHKKMNRAAALYAILYDLLADLNAVDAEHDKLVTDLATLDAQVDAAVVDFASLDAEFDKNLVDVAAIRTQVLAMIDDDDNFRTAYDAVATLKEVVDLGSPETFDDNQVVTSEDIPAQGNTLTIAADPDTVRNLVFTATVGGTLDVVWTAVGTDQFGDAVTETFNTVSATPVVGVKPFCHVTSITATTVTTDDGVNTIIVGAGSVLGLPVQITQAADCVIGMVAGVSEAVVAEATYHTVTMTSAPAGDARKVVIMRDSVGATAKTASDPGAITAGAVAYTAAGGLTPTAGAATIGVTAPEPKSQDPMVDN